MLELIRSIPGPTFLLVYLGLVALALGINRILHWWDGTEDLPLPPAEGLSAEAIAYLGGGWQAVVRAVFYRMVERGQLEISEDGEQTRVIPGGPRPSP
ncbi:MAG: hypothetical protein P1V51_00275 [Deltaproteobacteria bacterium]|nr:hypothetical protein [Deltaproteobacteria bacterium]